MDTSDIHQAAITWHRIFEDRPPDVHLCCPKVDDDDGANYDEPDVPDEGGISADEKRSRIKDYEERFHNVYNLSILMGLGPDVAGDWLDNWKQAVESYLTRCDSCVRNWHRHRQSYLRGL